MRNGQTLDLSAKLIDHETVEYCSTSYDRTRVRSWSSIFHLHSNGNIPRRGS